GITAVALAREVDVSAPSAPDVRVHPFPVLGAGCTDRRGVDEIEECCQDATACASRISVILRATAGKSLGSTKMRERPLLMQRTGRRSPSGVRHPAIVDSTGSGAVVCVLNIEMVPSALAGGGLEVAASSVRITSDDD